jgi:hypothetical protein
MNDQKRLEDIHKQALVGEILSDELDWVASKLQESPPELSYIQMLMILARQRAQQYRGLVEHFLEYRGDWSCVAEALRTLCRWWNDTHLYIDTLLKYMSAMEDESYNLLDVSEVRRVAISLAGEYLRDNKEPKLLNRLIELYENPDLPEWTFIKDPHSRSLEIQQERGFVRCAAYLAVAEAMGRAYRTLPHIEDEVHLNDIADPQIISRVRKRLEEESVL